MTEIGSDRDWRYLFVITYLSILNILLNLITYDTYDITSKYDPMKS
jgi:hypothetical protein